MERIKQEIRQARKQVRSCAQFENSLRAIKINEIFMINRNNDNCDWFRLLWLIENRQVLNLKEWK